MQTKNASYILILYDCIRWKFVTELNSSHMTLMYFVYLYFQASTEMLRIEIRFVQTAVQFYGVVRRIDVLHHHITKPTGF